MNLNELYQYFKTVKWDGLDKQIDRGRFRCDNYIEKSVEVCRDRNVVSILFLHTYSPLENNNEYYRMNYYLMQRVVTLEVCDTKASVKSKIVAEIEYPITEEQYFQSSTIYDYGDLVYKDAVKLESIFRRFI